MLQPKLKRFVSQYRWSVTGLVISLCLTLWLSFTVLARAIYFDDPRHQNEVLKPWMTPKYVSLSYDIPREVTMDVLGIDPEKKKPRRLDHIARDLGVTLPELTENVREVAANYHKQSDD